MPLRTKRKCAQAVALIEVKLSRYRSLAALPHWVNLAWKTVEGERFLRFCTVGASGTIVHLAVLWLLTDIYGLYYLYSAVVAIACAMANNFLWNEMWTFADRVRTHRTLSQRGKRFLRFNVICTGGALLNLGVLWLFTDVLGIHYLISAVIGSGATAVWNYSLNTNITW